jgi:hypothetical protein
MDASAPLIKLVSVRPRVLAPFAKRRNSVRIQYRTNEPARAFLYVDGDQRTRVFRFVRDGKIDWGPKAAQYLGPGPHRIRLRALDRATNFGPPSRALTIVVRDVELRPHFVRVNAGRRFGFRVLNAQRYDVQFRSLRRQRSGPILVLRAPEAPGRYVLQVATDGHVTRAVVVVTK